MNEEMTITSAAIIPAEDKAELIEYRNDCARFPRFSSISDQTAHGKLRGVIWKAFMVRGRKGDDDIVDFTTDFLINEIRADRSHLGLNLITLEEIVYVINSYALNKTEGKFDEICVATLYTAICDYAKTTGHELEKKADSLKACRPIDTVTDVYAQALLQNTRQ